MHDTSARAWRRRRKKKMNSTEYFTKQKYNIRPYEYALHGHAQAVEMNLCFLVSSLVSWTFEQYFFSCSTRCRSHSVLFDIFICRHNFSTLSPLIYRVCMGELCESYGMIRVRTTEETEKKKKKTERQIIISSNAILQIACTLSTVVVVG